MPWYMPNFVPISEYVKKKMCIYLLQRYLGKFFEEKLTLDQLSLDVYNGTGIVRDVRLDVQALNDLGEKQNWPMEIVDGYLEQLYVSVPWTSLLSESASLEVTGLKIIIQPKQRQESATSVFESMWSSMTSSMQLAKDYIKQEPHVEDSQPFEGIEKFAHTIDSVLTRIKIKFIDTIIQIEHVPMNSLTGVALQIRMGIIEYSDEAGSDPSTADEALPQDQGKTYVVSSYTTKRLHLDNFTLHTMEFPSEARTFNRSMTVEQLQSGLRRKGEIDLIDQLINPENSSSGFNDSITTANLEGSEERDGRYDVIFGKLMGKQEIRMHLKHLENVSGSKVSIEVNLGALILFLTPRQVHTLLELADGISSPDIEDESNVPPKQKCVEKPMSHLDYQRVEQDLQDQIHPNVGTSGLQGLCGWSKAMGMIDNDDIFHPMVSNVPFCPNNSSVMYDSAASHISNSMESSQTSSMISFISEVASVRKRDNIENDPSAEITNFQIRVASFTAVILHDDILALTFDECSRSYSLLASSVIQLKRTAETFFITLSDYNLTSYGAYQFEDTKPIFEKACQLNHLRLLAAPIQIEGCESTTLSAFLVSGKLSIAKLELLESLYNSTNKIKPSSTDPSVPSKYTDAVQYIRLLYFTEDKMTPTGTIHTFRIKPSVKLSFKQEKKFICSGRRSDYHVPKTELDITLDSCCIEMDITIVDRINALINGVPVCVDGNAIDGVWKSNRTEISSKIDKCNDFQLDLSINSAEMTINLRFPISDLRPKHDMNRCPWWQREVRADYLTLRLCDISAASIYSTKQLLFQKHTVRCKEIFVLYHETENCIPISLGQITSNMDPESEQQLPSFAVELRPDTTFHLDIDAHDVESMLQSAYPELNLNNSGPFSSTRVTHESDTPHAKLHQDDSKQLIIPGDRIEMMNFIKETCASSRILITINLPNIYIDIASKHMYEVLYNHINSDLMLWKPCAPEPQLSRTTTALRNTVTQIDKYYDELDRDSCDKKGVHMGNEWFGMCKSGIQYDSNSDTSSTDDMGPETGKMFESMYESETRSSKFHSNPMDKSYAFNLKEDQVGVKNTRFKPSEFALNFRIGNGKVYLSPPARDSSPSGTVLPNQQGVLLFLIDGACIFNVSAYAGDKNLSYVCAHVADVELQHCAVASLSNPSISFDTPTERRDIPLLPTIYKSVPGILIDCKGEGRQRDMFSMAMKIQANHETHHVKTIRIALGVNKATLRHRMCLEPNTWLTQLIDFFNVLDYAIPGYTPKDVLTEFHLHLWDCALDYRPLYLPVQSIVTMESFSMSSHLSPKSNTSTLRFIAQECQLHLSHAVSNKDNKKNAHKQDVVDLLRDYIPVVEIRLFELSLRTNDKKSGINPHINLRASNNIVNVHTCSDSGKALIELMTYFAQDGDLANNTGTEELSHERRRVANDQADKPGGTGIDSRFINKTLRITEQLCAMDSQAQDISNLSTSQHQQVNDMIDDAMEDWNGAVKIVGDAPMGEIRHGAQIFYFPDEGQIIPETRSLPPVVTTDLGDITFRVNKSNDTDDEFCIIGEEDPLKILSKSSTPDIRWLTKTTLTIIDNYFTIPLSKTDVLKRPKSCPIPIMEYTLREMTVIWHMYGGYDFRSSATPSDSDLDNSSSSKKVLFMDRRFETNEIGSVVFTNARTGEVILPELKLLQSETKDEKNISDYSSMAGHKIRGGKCRNPEVLIELQLNKVKFLHEVYPENVLQASRQVLAINDVEIRDRLKSSHINKFLYQYTCEAKPKQSHAHMVIIKAAHIRPDPKLKAQECSLKVSLLPLRLNIDQDSLSFLITFFTELSGTVSNIDEKATPTQNTPTHHPPVMTMSDDNNKEFQENAHKLVDDNLLILLEEDKNVSHKMDKNTHMKEMNCDTLIYFRSIIFHPEVPIRLDYTGKRVDMTHGSLPGLLMGLAQLNCSELTLKRLSYKYGLLGIEKLLSYCLQEWLMEIKRHQLPSLLGGIGPMHSLIMLAQGIIDLVRLPIEQYQKDGRIVRGLQRGASSFTTATAMAALELTSRLIHLIQITAETAYDMMSPGPSVRRRRLRADRYGSLRRRRQPEDIRAGAVMAYNVFKEGIEETAVNMIRDTSHEHEQKGVSGVVGGILRQIPPNVIVKPIILVSEATNNLLGGVQNQLVPDAKREANEKWKGNIR